MISTHKIKLMVGIGGLAIVIVVGGWYVQKRMVRSGKVRGIITMIDHQRRQAALEYVHPKTGTKQLLSGEISQDCPIYIGTQSATIHDLHVGDQVEAEGRIYYLNQRVIADHIRIILQDIVDSSSTSSPGSIPDSHPASPVE